MINTGVAAVSLSLVVAVTVWPMTPRDRGVAISGRHATAEFARIPRAEHCVECPGCLNTSYHKAPGPTDWGDAIGNPHEGCVSTGGGWCNSQHGHDPGPCAGEVPIAIPDVAGIFGAVAADDWAAVALKVDASAERSYYNPVRHSIQVTACSADRIIANIPLTMEQEAAYLAAVDRAMRRGS